MVLVGPVRPAVKFAMKLDDDGRWDASFDTVMRKLSNVLLSLTLANT